MIDREKELRKFVIDMIDQDYLKDSVGHFTNPLLAGIKTFLIEKPDSIKKLGLIAGMNDYFRGLPSWIDLPIYRGDVENFLYAMGYDDIIRNWKDDDERDLFEFYYNTIAEVFADELTSVGHL